jgi:ferredoxin
MKILQYHKGSFCVYKSIFCQEGYCSNCEVYLRESYAAKTTGDHDGWRNVRKLQAADLREARN